VIGRTAPGDTVDLLDPNGIVLASTSAALTTGAYALQPATNLKAGVLPLRVRVHDAAGNVSPPGAAFNLTVVDTSPSDFDGDGKTDLALFRPANGLWIVPRSSGGSTTITQFGAPNFYDIPVPGDYDGIGRTELALFRPSTAQWIILGPGGPRVVNFGAPNLFDIPVPGDYDGVGYTEPAIYRPSTGQWFALGPNGGHLVATFGAPNLFDVPVPGDYDGTGHTEPAVFRPSTAQWFVLGPTGGRLLGSFGAPNFFDVPIPGDYDGIGRTELAIFRPSTTQFFVLGPTGGRLLGASGTPNLFDIPTEAPVASLRKLGVVGGPRIMSFHGTISAAPRSAALSVSPATTPPATASASAPTVFIAPVRSRTRPAQDVVSAAIESLAGED
jgi:hypothetical protein